MEGMILSESVRVHLTSCDACRSWADDFRLVDVACRESSPCGGLSNLTARTIEMAAQPEGASPGPGSGPKGQEPAIDRGALLLVLLAAVAINVVLYFVLDGLTQVVLPLALLAAMVGVSLWVWRDASKRRMPSAFWTALQPVAIPAGLVAYLVCRERRGSRCEGCGRRTPEGDRFCADCGSKLTEFCCGCGRAVRREFRVCPFCGKRLEECFPRDESGRPPCGWSRGQVGFVVLVNVALAAAVVATFFVGGQRLALAGGFAYLFGFLPVFNWVSIDSRRRAMSTIPWGALTLGTLYAGLVVYLACRKDERVVCPVCGSHPPASFNYCPCCGSRLGAGCPACGAARLETDRFCSWCGVELT